MGNVIQNMTGLSLIVGMNSALETLVAQARGDKNYELCGVYLNRGRLITTVMFIPVIFILNYADKILVLLHQSKEVAKYSQEYILATMPGLFFNGLIDGQRRFLNCFELTKVALVI